MFDGHPVSFGARVRHPGEPIRHRGARRGPAGVTCRWIPASAGMTGRVVRGNAGPTAGRRPAGPSGRAGYTPRVGTDVMPAHLPVRARPPSRFLRMVFRVRPGEAERVVLMLLFSMLAVGGIVITGQLVGRSLFLGTLPASAIPLRFILPPIAMVAAVAAYTQLLRVMRHARLIQLTFAVTLVGVLAFRWLVSGPAGDNLAVLLALFVFLDSVGALTMILFWTFAGDLFNPREAKRLFGLVSGGSAISNVAFGAMLGQLATSVRPENLLLVVLASVALSMLVVWHLDRRYGSTSPAPAHTVATEGTDAAGSLLTDLGDVFRSPLLAAIATIVILIALSSNIADFQLDLALKDRYGSDSQGMVQFLATFRFWAGLVAVLLQFVVAAHLMERFGILPALLLLPVAIGVGATAILASGGALWAVVIPRAADVALKYTVNDSAFNLLYLPLSSRLRMRAKAVLDGVIKPPLVAALGLGFLAASRWTSVSLVWWSVPLLVLVGLWMAFLYRASRQYVHALSHSLTMRRLDLREAPIDVTDETSVRVVLQSLDSPDGLRVIHTLSLLREASTVDFSDRVAELLAHPEPEVRLEALRYLVERTPTAARDRIMRLMDDEDVRVRAAAIGAGCQMDGNRAIPTVTPFLTDDAPPVRGAAIVGLIKCGGLGGVLRAAPALNALFESAIPAERREAARLLGALGVHSFNAPLLDLMDDDDPDVQVEAIRAAAEIGTAEFVPKLVDQLSFPPARAIAERAIVACSGGNVAALEGLLADRELPRDIRLQVPRLLTVFGAPAVAILAQAFDDPDDSLRAAVHLALLTVRDSGHRIDLDTDRLDAQIHHELRVSFDRTLARDDLHGQQPWHPLLDEHFERAVRRDHDRLLSVLALRYPALPIAKLRDALIHRDDPRVRATAVELLDNIVVRAKDLVIACLGGSADQQVAIAEYRLGLRRAAPAARWRQFLHDVDPWTRACALAAVGTGPAAELVADMEAALRDPDECVRQSAAFALVRAQGQPAVRGLAASLAGDPRAGRTFDDIMSRIDRRQEGSGMALAPLEKVLFLKQVPLFKEISGEEIAGILPIVDERTFTVGAEIIRQGDEGDSLFIIVEGRVGITIDGRSTGTVLESRAVIGELAILTGDPRAATCTALTEVLALGIHRDPFWQLIRERPEVSVGVIRILLGYIKK